MFRPLLLLAVGCLTSFGCLPQAQAEDQWVSYAGKEGPGRGKKIVFVTGDDEYFSEQGMPLLARMLAEKHGFSTTVLFAINKATGVIDTNTKDNIPGLEALDTADLMVIFTRFRALPDEQMKHVHDFVKAGKPVIGLRTATHAFAFPPNAATSYRAWHWQQEGGFGKEILGETWVNHWGKHGGQSTRGVFAPGAAQSPLLRGVGDGEIWVSTDVYEVHLPLPPDSTPLVLGQIVAGMKPTDPPATFTGPVDKNNPMMPVAWTREIKTAGGGTQRVFTSTMGGAMAGSHDWDSEAFRRLFTNACYWCTGLEAQIPAKAEVPIAADSPFKRGVKPADAAAKL